MKLGVVTQLICELFTYGLVAITVFSSAFGAPLFAPITAFVVLALFIDMAVGTCDPWVRVLGDAPKEAYDGKVVWITGASQGLGEELALHLAKLGAKLILARNQRFLEPGLFCLSKPQSM